MALSGAPLIYVTDAPAFINHNGSSRRTAPRISAGAEAIGNRAAWVVGYRIAGHRRLPRSLQPPV